MTLRPVAYVGAVAPEGVSVQCNQGGSGIDLTTVTSAQMLVQNPDGTEASWAASLSGATALQVTATHTFASTDLPMPGRYVVVVALAIGVGGAGGTVRTRPKVLTVLPKFAIDNPVAGG